MSTHIVLKRRASETLDPEEDLLDLYLSLPAKLRIERFADTAHAAQVVGLSVRTIQLWIETGSVRAITVGKKYQVDLESLREHLRSGR
jgi:excisionase family DNA binding protein